MKEASSICDRATETGSALVTPAVVDRWRERMVTSAIMEESALSDSMIPREVICLSLSSHKSNYNIFLK